VYRRDEPQVHHGRFREFYQCDLDIAGNYDLMVPDVEVLCVLWDILNEFKESIGDFIIKVNHRKLLDAILDICGINEDNFKSVCSSIDKIDKIGWKGVQEELVTSKVIHFFTLH
jgi:histidyl-tRNA synthetase